MLADHLRLPGPNDTPISYGDLVLAFGLVGVGYRIGADRRGAHAARPNAAPMIVVPPDEPLFPEEAPALVRAWPMTAAEQRDMETTTVDLEPVAAFFEGVTVARSSDPEPIDLVDANGLGVDLDQTAAFFEAVVEARHHGIAPDGVDLDQTAAFFEGVAAAEHTAAASSVVPVAEEPDEPAYDRAIPDDLEPIEALWIEETGEIPVVVIATPPIPPLPEVTTDVDETEATTMRRSTPCSTPGTTASSVIDLRDGGRRRPLGDRAAGAVAAGHPAPPSPAPPGALRPHRSPDPVRAGPPRPRGPGRPLVGRARPVGPRGRRRRRTGRQRPPLAPRRPDGALTPAGGRPLAAVVSYRLGGTDGVSVEAAKWQGALPDPWLRPPPGRRPVRHRGAALPR